MASLRRVFHRVCTAFRPNRAEDELAREIQAHLLLMEEDFRSRGMTTEDARLAARRAFGGVESAKELQRDARAFRWMDDARRDVTYACRSLARTPGFASAAVVTLALGIGATTAVFTLFDTALLRPLAVERPDELRVVRQSIQLGARLDKATTYVPYDWFLQLRPRPEVFSEVMAFADLNDALLTANGRETRLSGGGLFVSDNYFDLLGVRPAIGRTFLAAGSRASDRVAVLSSASWLREFGGARDVVGRSILINGAAFTIVGVSAPAFVGLELGRVPDVFLPLETISDAQPAIVPLANRASWTVQVVGRLRAEVSNGVASERLTSFRDFVEPPKPAGIRHVLQVLPVETGLSDVRERFAQPLSVMLVMGSVLLLIACANVATLLGARASSRRAEMVIRSAIGAAKGRLLRQLITETLVVAAVAGVMGAFFGSWATRMLVDLLPQGSNPLQFDIAMDRRVLVFTGVISCLSALLAGVMPALRSLGFDLAASLRDRSRGGVGGPSRGRPFAVAQVALSVVLVAASTMFARTVYNLATVDVGFNPDHLIQVSVDPGSRSYSGAALDQYYRGVFERLRAVPGIRSVTSSQVPLLERARTTGSVDVPGLVLPSADDRMAQVLQVGPAFFQTTGIAVVRGRDFTEQDITGTQRSVVAINEVAARRFFGTDDPIGRTLRSDVVYQVVALVRGAKYNSLREEEPAVLFVPYTSVRQRARMIFLVRVTDETDATIRALAAAVRGEDPLVPFSATPMRTYVARSIAQERLLAVLSIAFAFSALVLLAIGLYGLMTFWVAERTPEIGIHLALGARLSRVRWVVMRQPLQLAAIGLALGLPAALAGSRAVDSLMFGVRLQDPSTVVAATVMILAVTLLACWPAARRAARVDPMTALRSE